VDYIFHAAALKQVPTGEYFPAELVATNILGTQNVLDAAEENNVKKVVLLSTDKAVYPINAMGMSKGIAEKLIFANARESSGTIFCAVRYGNVMASRGSVIPLFIEYIKNNKPLTVTDPNMTRFLLSLDDALELVLLAIQKGDQGDLFIKKAPAATIGDLTQALINIFKSKSKINVVGVRVGEKIHETLATQLELARAEDLGTHFRIRPEDYLDYNSFISRGVVKTIENDYTSENTKRLSVKEIEKLLLSLDYIKRELKNIKKS
jgi:UDP-glucose 4-epimerase